MKRKFTKREKVMLVVLAVLLVGVAYYQFVFTPVNAQVASLQAETANEMTLTETLMPRAVRLRDMKAEIEQLRASGSGEALPEYDNFRALMDELNLTLSAAQDYSLSFSGTHTDGYIVRRPITMTFTAASYAAARNIIDSLHDSDYTNQISDLLCTENRDGNGWQVNMTICYYELNN